MQNVDFGKFLGVHVSLETSYNETMAGEIFCYDIEKSSVVLRNYNEKGIVSYKWLKTNIIRNVQVNPPAPSPSAADERLAAVSLDEIAKAATRAEQKAKTEIKNIGIGVTDRAQRIFDALNFTMPCKWDKDEILVYGVRIESPYEPTSCSGGDDCNALDRVKKVLQGEIQRIEKKTKLDDKNGE